MVTSKNILLISLFSGPAAEKARRPRNRSLLGSRRFIFCRRRAAKVPSRRPEVVQRAERSPVAAFRNNSSLGQQGRDISGHGGGGPIPKHRDYDSSFCRKRRCVDGWRAQSGSPCHLSHATPASCLPPVNELDDSPARDPPVCPQKHRDDRSLGHAGGAAFYGGHHALAGAWAGPSCLN